MTSPNGNLVVGVRSSGYSSIFSGRTYGEYPSMYVYPDAAAKYPDERTIHRP